MDPVLVAALVTSATALLGLPVTYLAGRRGRVAATSRDEADATESLSAAVSTLGQRLDQVSTALWDAHQRLDQTHQRLALSEQRATAAEQRASAAELRAATADAELVRLRAEVASSREEVAALRAELARYEAAGPAEQRVA